MPGMHRGDSLSRAYSHPAFGQISAHRISGSTTLYDSDFVHHNFIEISIRRSELSRDHAHDWHFPREELIAVKLSEAQWATFVSSLNMGSGVPCTLDTVAGQPMPDIPLRKQEDATKADLDIKVREATELVNAAIKDIEGELGESISKKKRDAILGHLRQLQRSVAGTMPFVVESFAKQMEQTVEKAKVEVNAYMYSTIQRAGLQAIAGGVPGPLQLGSGTELGERVLDEATLAEYDDVEVVDWKCPECGALNARAKAGCWSCHRAAP